ncbi:MAG: PDZ domain-containing protein [Chitinophagaceae bacterium]
MKQTWVKFSAVVLAVALLVPAAVLAQKEEKEKDKEVKEKKEVEQIIITRKGDDKEKVVVEINGDKVTINGKPLDEYKDKDGNVTVRRSRYKTDYDGLLFDKIRSPRSGTWNFNGNNNLSFLNEDANKAMLGVSTEKTEEGVKVIDITKESAADKIGLKEGDFIKSVDDKKIETPDDLSAAIQAHKPGDKVSITYTRDKKEQKATAELTKWKGMSGTFTPFKVEMDNMNFDKSLPRVFSTPGAKTPYGQNWSWSNGGPKLGLSVQDSDDGKGVKVIEVDEESSSSKAGIKEGDIITEVDSKAVNSTDDMVKMIRESKDKTSIMVKLLRAGKTQNIEVKMPRKIKTADL